MSREIKFRGMTINGDWVYGFVHIVPRVPSKYQRVEAGTYISNSAGSPFAYQVNPGTVCEYIGLRDKNGVDVYDGDIYRNLDNGLIGKLRILDGVGGLYVLCTEYKDGRIYNNRPFAELDTTNFEVIGNIYENADLLNQEVI